MAHIITLKTRAQLSLWWQPTVLRGNRHGWLTPPSQVPTICSTKLLIHAYRLHAVTAVLKHAGLYLLFY